MEKVPPSYDLPLSQGTFVTDGPPDGRTDVRQHAKKAIARPLGLLKYGRLKMHLSVKQRLDPLGNLIIPLTA